MTEQSPASMPVPEGSESATSAEPCDAWTLVLSDQLGRTLRASCRLGSDHAADHEATLYVVPADVQGGGSEVLLWWENGYKDVRCGNG